MRLSIRYDLRPGRRMQPKKSAQAQGSISSQFHWHQQMLRHAALADQVPACHNGRLAAAEPAIPALAAGDPGRSLEEGGTSGLFWTFEQRVVTLVILADLDEDWRPSKDVFRVADFESRLRKGAIHLSSRPV
jgi:hypothetical protein